jgi:hypothetical protein
VRIEVFSVFCVLLIGGILLLNGCVSQQSAIRHIEISEIIVLDSQFNTVKVINQPEQLQAINSVWQQLTPIDTLPNAVSGRLKPASDGRVKTSHF